MFYFITNLKLNYFSFSCSKISLLILYFLKVAQIAEMKEFEFWKIATKSVNNSLFN